MKALHVVFLVAALTGAATCLFKRKYISVSTSMSWTDAQTYCREHYIDLLTMTSTAELNTFKSDFEDAKKSWIGLSKNPQETVYTQWSDGSKLEFTAWGSGEPSNRSTSHCVTIFETSWYASSCTTNLTFFCYKWVPDIIMVKEKMSWEEGLKYCRMNYTDMISVTTNTDLVAVNLTSMYRETARVWTGLRFMNALWFWVNQDPLQNLTSLPSCPIPPYHCGAIKPEGGTLENMDCNEKLNFICYNKNQKTDNDEKAQKKK